MSKPIVVSDVESDDDMLMEIKQELEDDYEVKPTPTPKLTDEELMASVYLRGTLRVMVERWDLDMLQRHYPKVDWKQKMKNASTIETSPVQKRGRGRPRKAEQAPSPEVKYSSDDEETEESSKRKFQEDAAKLIAILEGKTPDTGGPPKRRLVRPSRFSDYVVSKNPAVVDREVVSSAKSGQKVLKSDTKKVTMVKVVKEPLKDGRNQIPSRNDTDSASRPSIKPNKPLIKPRAIVFEDDTSEEDKPNNQGKRKIGSVNGVIEPASKKPLVMKNIAEETPPEFQFLRKINGFVLVPSFESLVDQLRQRELLETHVETMLVKQFSSSQIYELMRSNNPGENDDKKGFTRLQSKFALIIYLYAPKCYRFLKTMFTLPSSKCLSRAVDSVNGNFGFFSEALHFIKDEINRSKVQDYCIVIDSVPLLPQETVTSAGDICGSRQICGAYFGDGTAKEAILIVAVCLGGGPRLPIGLFASDTEWGGLGARLVDLAVSKLIARGAKVWAVGMDASARSMRVLRHLGVNFDPQCSPELCFYRHHPSNSQVYVILDSAHLLQLARFSQFLVRTGEGEVMWPLVSNLLFSAKNVCKNSDKDVLLENLYMCHSLSRYTGQAIDYMRNTSGKVFALSQPTSSFINHLNDLHDIANSQTPFKPESLTAVTKESCDSMLSSINNTIDYFTNINLHYSKIIDHNNCTCKYHDKHTFLYGCHLTLQSLKSIIVNLFKKSNFNVLNTNKFSLDSIDLMYSSICHWNGTDGFLTLLQLKEGLMDILCQSLNEYTTYNLPTLSISYFRSPKRCPRRVPYKCGLTSKAFVYMLRSSAFRGEYQTAGLLSVCNSLVGELSTQVTCSECAGMLRADTPIPAHNDFALLNWERYWLSLEGGNAEPSRSLLQVVTRCEMIFRKAVITCPKNKIVPYTIKNLFEEFLEAQHFPFREYEHTTTCADFEPLHEYQLIVLVCKKYLSLRMSSFQLLMR